MTVYFTFSIVLLRESNNNMNCSISFFLLLFHQSYSFSSCHHHYHPSYFKNSNTYESIMELFGNFRLVSDRFSRLITFYTKLSAKSQHKPCVVEIISNMSCCTGKTVDKTSSISRSSKLVESYLLYPL